MTKVEPFVFNGVSSRVIFGHGALARTGDEIRKLGHGRALVLSTPNQGLDEEALSKRLDPLSAGVFAEAVMHTPVEVTEKALAAFQASGADCVVSLGGGSLKDFGLKEADLDRATAIAIKNPYSNPRPFDAASMRSLLQDAWAGAARRNELTRSALLAAIQLFQRVIPRVIASDRRRPNLSCRWMLSFPGRR